MPRIWFDDPVIQAAWEKHQAGPLDILPKPEAVTLGLLRWLLEQTKGPYPLAADEPDRHAVYCRIRFLVDAVPGIGELTRRLNSELGAYLTGPATIAVRDRLSRCTGRSFADVDRMLISEIAGLPWEAPVSTDVTKFTREKSQPHSTAPSGIATPEAPAELPEALPPRREQESAGPDASGSNSATPIDFNALVNALLEQGKPTQAALVRVMADRETATAEEIGDSVHGYSKAKDKTIAKNARETSDSLTKMGSRLSFRFASGTMFRRIDAE